MVMFEHRLLLILGIPGVFCLLNVMSVLDYISPVKVMYIRYCQFSAMVPYAM